MSFKLTIGRVGFAARDLFPNEAIAWIRPKREDVDPGFLACALEAFDFSGLGGRAVKGQTLNSKTLNGLEICLPPLHIQKGIAEMIDAFDVVLSAQRRHEQALADLENSLLQDLISNNDEWALKPLGEVSETHSGSAPKSGEARYWEGGKTPFLKIGDLADGPVYATSSAVTDEAVSDYRLRLYEPGTVLIAMYGATRGKLGLLEIEATGNQAILAVTAKPCIRPAFLFFALRARQRELLEAGFGGAQKNLSQEFLRAWQIPVPSLEDQDRVIAVANAAAETGRAARRAEMALAVARDAALRALLGGKHSLPVASVHGSPDEITASAAAA